MRIRTAIPVILAILFALPVNGQSWRSRPFEIYAGIGPANYFGDIGGTPHEENWYGIRDLDIFRSRPGFIAGLRHIPGRFLAVNGSVALGWLSGDDKGGRNEARGYVFNTAFLEISGRGEFFPVRDVRLLRGVNRRGLVRNYGTFSFYLFGGAGAIIYRVMPNEALEARRERDNLEHGMVTMVLPAGAGVKLGISNTMDIGFELGGRYSLNDYLDGFTSPTATSNDIYYITTVKLVYRLSGLGL